MLASLKPVQTYISFYLTKHIEINKTIIRCADTGPVGQIQGAASFYTTH